MSAARQRKLQRSVHLAGAVVLIAYVYTPADAQLQGPVRWVVFPLLVLTGVAMWQAAGIRHRLKAARRRRTPPGIPTRSARTGE